MKLLILVVICSVLVNLHQSVIQRPRPNQKPKQSPRPDWAQTKELDTEIIKDDGEECVKKCNARIKEYNEKYNGYDGPHCGEDGKTYPMKELCPIQCSGVVELKCKGKCPCPDYKKIKYDKCVDKCEKKLKNGPFCGKDGKTYSIKEFCPIECSEGLKLACEGKCPCPKPDWRPIPDKFLKTTQLKKIKIEEYKKSQCVNKCNVKIKNWYDGPHCGKDGRTYPIKEFCPMKCSKGFDSNFWICKGKCPCPKPDWRPIPNDKFLKPQILVDPKPDWRLIPNDKFLKPHILVDPKPDWRPIPNDKFLKPHILVDPKPDWRPIPNDKFLKPHILVDPKPDWRPIPEESLRKQIFKDLEYNYKEGPIKDYIEYDYIKPIEEIKMMTESDESDIMLAKQALKNFDKFRGFCANKKWHPTKSLCKPLGDFLDNDVVKRWRGEYAIVPKKGSGCCDSVTLRAPKAELLSATKYNKYNYQKYFGEYVITEKMYNGYPVYRNSEGQALYRGVNRVCHTWDWDCQINPGAHDDGKWRVSGAPGAVGFFWSEETHKCPSEIKHWDLQRTNFNWKYNIQSNDISIFCTDNTDHPHHRENDIDLDWALDSVEEEEPEENSWIDDWLTKLKKNGGKVLRSLLG